MRELELARERVNVNGGAIALCHPLVATGEMLLCAAADELHRSGGETSLVTLRIGGGTGFTAIVERI